MTETQLFYLTIMIGLFVAYLVVSKICEAMENIAQSKAVQAIESKNITRVDCDNAEDFQKVIQEINNAINKEEE